jgi:hypothetical protein
MSPPPYELRDKATGEVVPDFDNMDTAPGRFIEVYSGTASGNPDTRISGGALERPADGGTPPIEPPIEPPVEPPIIEPIPPTGEGMDYPTNEAQLRECLNMYAASQYVGMLDPRVNIETTSPIVLTANASSPWGVNGNYAKITYRGSGDDCLRVEGQNGQNNRGLTLKNLVLDGGDGGNMSGGGAAACLRVSAPLGDNGPIYKFHLENLFMSGAVNGLILEGGVYEGECRTMHVENCTGDGIILRHLPASESAKGPIVSNIKFWHVNSSRNYGVGLRTVYSVYIFGASFVLNGGGGIYAPDGLRGGFGINGENTGGSEQCVVHVPSNGYGSVIEVGEASSDGQTKCRKWNGSAWEDVGQPLLYFASVGEGVEVLHSHVSYYGGGSNPMRVLK